MPAQVALAHLVDLALGSPEVGAVNFNVLHTLLHAMIQKLNIQDVKADIDEHDREFLSSHAVPRAFSAFSADSGLGSKGEDSFSLSEDNLSEKSSYASHKKSPYHRLEKQVSELMKQMDELNKLPSNEQLMGKSSKGRESERPVSEMWQYMQMKNRVDANEEGIGKLVSLVEDLMKDMRDMKESQQALKDKVDKISFDDIYKRLNDLDSQLKDLDDKYSKLETKMGSVPSLDDIEQYLSTFVTWPGLEDALKGIRLDFENLQPISEERVVIELGTQTETPKGLLPDHTARRMAQTPDKMKYMKKETDSQIKAPEEQKPEQAEVLKRRSPELIKTPKRNTPELNETQRHSPAEQIESPKRSSPDVIETPKRGSPEPREFLKQQSHDRIESQKRQTPDIFIDLEDEPKSRPTSARPASRASTISTGPSAELLDILERLGRLASAHEELTKRVEELERLMETKANKGDLEGLGISDDLLSSLKNLQEEIKALQEGQLRDSASLRRLQEALQKLQTDIEQIRNAMDSVMGENEDRKKEIKELNECCDNLDKNKADKQYVDTEVDVKADRHQLEGKVNHSLFDTTTNELNRMIKDILDKLNGHEEGWKSALAKAMEELDGKLDRMELRNLKDWLEKQLKSINNKIKTMGPGYQLDDEAAGMKKQLIQRFNCLSCDKPVDVMPHGPIPSIPGNYALPRSKSPRPYTTFELDQIRQHARRIYNGLDKTKSNLIRHDRCLPFSMEAYRRQNRLEPIERTKPYQAPYQEDLGMGPEITDYFSQVRQCGGHHTLTYPNKRTNKLNNLGQILSEEETVLPLYKDEIDVQGADGHIYKGRMESARLEAKLPVNLSTRNSQPVYMQPKAPSPQPPHRPLSARVPRPGSARPESSNSQHRSQSAMPMRGEESMAAPQNSQIGGSRATTPLQEDAEVAVDLVAGENFPAGQEQHLQEAVEQDEVIDNSPNEPQD